MSDHAVAFEPTGARGRRGTFAVGDRVQLTDTKGRRHTVVLEPGKLFHTHHGAVHHDDLLGATEGVVVSSTSGMTYLAFRPLLLDHVLAMPRGATVVYPKDSAQIVTLADVFPGAHVIEAGAGSGALSCALLRAVGDAGSLTSYERRADFAAVARRNVEAFFSGPHPAWTLVVGDLVEQVEQVATGKVGDGVARGDSAQAGAAGAADRVVLDMLAPWECVDAVAAALAPGGVVCCYVATTTQLSTTVEALRSSGSFAEPAATETMQRDWHVAGLAVRPSHRMVGHTGFLVTARRMADGVSPPPRRRRPAPGSGTAPMANR